MDIPSEGSRQRASIPTILKLFLPSSLGVLIFFVPVEIAGRSTILLDHMVTGARSLLGLLAAKYTPLFEWLGWLFYPFVAIWGLEDAAALAQASAAGLAEMFLPALLMAEAEFVARFAAGVVSVSAVLFFSASIPCILSTSISLTVGRMLVVWFIRVALSLLLAVPTGYLVQAMVG
ncbi:hypothetical protein ACM26W_19205 [Halomonas sp. HK25]|uniref:hypothetical protein n=1 Tax=Halomonas sp. HK25 TaxID=3394321 RepID=UPI0039FC2635